MSASLEAPERVQMRFEDLARRFGAELMRYTYEKTGSLADAADIVQRVYLKGWGAWRSGARPENPRAWLYRIAHNEVANHLRRRRTGLRILRVAARSSGPDEPDARLSAELRETAEAVRALPAPYADAVLLHYLQGLSIGETAQVLGVPAGTAKSQIARGLNLLRSRLGGKR